MKTYKQKRKHFHLIIFVIIIILFLVVRANFIYNLAINSKAIKNINSEGLNDEQYENILSPFREIHFNLIIQFALCLILISTISFIIIVIKEHKSTFDRLILLAIFGILVWIVCEVLNTFLMYNYPIYSIEIDKYFITLLPFIPHIYYIYKYSIVGIKIDITNQVEKEYKNTINDLQHLTELGLLSKSESDAKKEKKLKEKIMKGIKDTKEYTLLNKAKNDGILTQAEFDLKIANFVNITYNSEINNNIL